MLPTPPSRQLIAFCGTALLALLSAGLPVEPAQAFPVVFDGPSGYGIGSELASDAIDAGFTRISTEEIARAADLGLAIPEPQVLSAAISSSPSPAHPTTAHSIWTVHNDGEVDLSEVWLVFLKPLTYSAPLVGIDLQSGSWGVVDVDVYYEEESYYYPAVFLGNIAAGAYAQFEMHHVIGEPLTRELTPQGERLILPKYGVGALAGAVPEPTPVILLAALLCGLALRRGRTE